MKILSPKAEVKAILSILEGTEEVKLELLNALSEEHFGYRPMHGAFTVISKMLYQSAMDLPTMETFLQHHELEQDTVDELTTPTSSPISKKDDSLRLCEILEYYRQVRTVHSYLREQTRSMRDEKRVAVDDLIADMEETLSEVRSDVHEAKMYHTGRGAGDDVDDLVQEAFSPDMPRLIPSTFNNFDRKTKGFGANDLVILASHMKGGKCVAAGTMIETEAGLVPIESLFDGTEKNDEAVPLGIKVVDRYGTATATHKLTKWHDRSMCLTSQGGYNLTASRVHPVLILDSDTNSLIYKKMQELVPGDYIVINKKNHLFPKDPPALEWTYPEFEQVTLSCPLCGFRSPSLPVHLAKDHPDVDSGQYREENNPELEKLPRVHDSVTNTSYTLPKTMSEDMAAVLGYLVSYGQIMPSCLSFSQSDPLVLQDFCDRFRRVFPDAPLEVTQEGNNPTYKKAFIGSKYICNFLSYFGLKVGHPREQGVPWIVLRSPKECVRSFLRSYFEGSGGVGKKRLITCTSSSEILVNGIQQLLLRFGVICRTTGERRRATNGSRAYRTYHRLVISKAAVSAFINEVGFVTERKMQAVPITPRRSKEAIDNDLYFDEIKEVKDIEGRVQLYDLSVAGSHSYVANGIVVHNSILALNMCVEQYLQHDLDVVYIPLEMSKEETVQRLLSKISTVEHTKIRTKTWNSMELKQARKAWRRFKAHGVKHNCRFTVWPIASLTIPQLRMRLRPMKYQVVLIDYLNLLIDPNNNDQEWLRLGNFARDLKIMTKELDSLIIAPTQMNMDGEIRYSKAIKEHANTVWTWSYGEEEIGTHIITINQPAVRGWAPFKFQLMEDFERMSIKDHLGSDFDADDFSTIKNETMRGV